MDFLTFIFILLSFITGFMVGYLLLAYKNKDKEQENLLKVQWAESERRLLEEKAASQKALFEKEVNAMEEHFKSVAADVLKNSTENFQEQFLSLAKENFRAEKEVANKDLEARQKAVENLISPIKAALTKLEENNQEIEKNREGAYQGLKSTLMALQQQTQNLATASTSLSTALTGSSQARGSWGEISLKNIAEAAGMLQHCDFDIQMTLETGAGGARADMLVTLPGGGMIPLDAKAPLTAFVEAQKASSKEDQQKALKKLSKDVRKHVDELMRRDYAQYAERGVDFTVMFIPSEPVLSAAYEADSELQEYAFSRRILITTPVTLLALLRTVAVYWRHEAIMENATDIAENARELYDRVAKFAEHLSNMGSSLRKTLGAYNDAVGSFERRVIPVGKRLKELDLDGGNKEIPSLPNLEEEDTRALSALPEPVQIK
ncbi:MAG: hypothetical protein CMH56_17485 [Myxococcales bacterium]|nr:hypothetical protein [Myxococcales bacterium]